MKHQGHLRFLAGALLSVGGLCMADAPTGLSGGVWSREGETPPYLEADPSAERIVFSDKVLRLEPSVYLRGFTLRGLSWIDNDRYLAEVWADSQGDADTDEQRRIVVVDTRHGKVRETARNGRIFCYRDGVLINSIYRKGVQAPPVDGKRTLDPGKTTYYEGPLEGAVEQWQLGRDETIEPNSCERTPVLVRTSQGQEKLREFARAGWEFSWSQPRPLRHGFGTLMRYARAARAWDDPQLANNPQAQAMARQPFTSTMRVASGTYALTYVTPSGKPVDIPLNPGEDVSMPMPHHADNRALYFATEDAYFLPMVGALVPFGLPAELRGLPRFARLLYRDGRVRLFSPPKVLLDEVVAKRDALQGYYSAAGIIWIQISGSERHQTYYLQKGRELVRIEGLPQRNWFVMPDGCHVHLSEIDRRDTYYSKEFKQNFPFTVNRYMTANLCQ
jgi:hypothetical protein